MTTILRACPKRHIDYVYLIMFTRHHNKGGIEINEPQTTYN